MIVNKAIAVNIGLFEARNNVRKSLGSHSLSYFCTSGNVTQVDRTLAASAGLTLAGASDVLIIRTDTPIVVNLTMGIVAGVRASEEVVALKVAKFLMIDDNVTAVSITNTGSNTAQVVVTQG